jgi:potassium/chloride transporter 4/5/6
MNKSATQRTLGTFLGVFTPSILTILGVVLFLRTGWVVGQVGIGAALVIVVVAHLITIATALSVSAIATNMQVGAGGAYFMISRSLGLEIGGAIGIPLFLAQTFSVTLYAFGFAEAVRLFWPDAPLQLTAAAVIVVVSLAAAWSAEAALKLQLPIMAAIGLALVSLLIGSGLKIAGLPALWQGVENGLGFWPVFAVFFPAVTGLMAGVSLSGDLEDPKRSIPRGTLAAVGTGFAVYLIVPVALAVAAPPEALAENTMIWFDLAIVPVLVIPGLLGAILSSAVGSILGAPRTLEALVDDGVLSKAAQRTARWPRRQLVFQAFSTTVALVAVALGDLNAVAPVLTMFFLTTYGVINLVAGLELLSGSPFYRPSIKVPWFVSLGGGLGCLWVMFLINELAALAAVVIEILVYLGLRRRAFRASWGDVRYGALMSLARAVLLRLRSLPVAPQNWRPNILVFAGDVARRVDLVRLAAWLNQDRGLLTVSKVIVGSREEHAGRVGAEREEMNRQLADEGIAAFPEVEIVSAVEEGVIAIAQANGIAGISSNTIMFGWSEKEGRLASQLRIMREVSLIGKSTIICRIKPESWTVRPRRIDVWWGGLQNNGDMLLLLAYLVSLNSEWRSAEICIRSIATSEMMQEHTEKSLRQMLQHNRIAARIEITPWDPDANVQELIQKQSRDADLVFLGLREPKMGEEMEYAQRLRRLIGDLPSVVFVRNAGIFAGQLLEEGEELSALPD